VQEIIPGQTDCGRTRVLVTGGAGYIGSLLCRELLHAGYLVRVLDNFRYGDGAIQGLFGHAGFEAIHSDCRDKSSVERALSGIQQVVHLAAIVGDQACAEECQAAIAVNYSAARMLAEAARAHGANRFVFASTCSIYGTSDDLMDEGSAANPLSVYALTKITAEEAILRTETEYFHPVVLRLATVFGLSYRPRFDLVVNLLTANAYHRGLITIFNGCQWRPFIHVRDVASGIRSILSSAPELVHRQVFNLGDSRMNYTLNDVAEAVRRRLPNTSVEYVDNADRRNYRVSFNKVRERIGFQSSVGLDKGIEELCVGMEQYSVSPSEDASRRNGNTCDAYESNGSAVLLNSLE
jgi:nucleoside-diphosphate-sugar epimerase